MKTVGVFFLCMLFSCSAVMANLSGSDDFNDNTMDPAKWSVLMGDTLVETNSRLEYSGGTGEVVGGWQWELNSGSYTHDWSISIDVVNALDETSLSNQEIDFGLVAWDTPDDNLFSVGFIVGDDAGGSYRYIETEAENNNGNVLNQQTSLSSDSARLQISFDASAKVFTSYYDSGSGLTMLTNYNISGWGLTDSDVFTVAVYSLSSDVSPASGEVYGDNFAAIPEPGTLGLLTIAIGVLLLSRSKR